MNKRRSYTVAFGLALIACASLVAYPRIRNVIHNASKTSSQAPASSQNQSVSIHANGEGWPWIILQDGRELPTEYAVGASLDRTLLSKSAQPTALAAADFDSDGVPDLITAYATENGGLLTLHRGNGDSIYPNSPDAQAHKAQGTYVDQPFYPDTNAFSIPITPDWIAASDFDMDGRADVLVATLGSSDLYLLPGDAHSGFDSLKHIQLRGGVTAFVTDFVNGEAGLPGVVVGIDGPTGPQALIYHSGMGLLNDSPDVISLSQAATALAIGHLDETLRMDVAIAAGNQLQIVHSEESARDRSEAPIIETRDLPYRINALAAGNFVRGTREELALLSTEGTVYLLDPGKRVRSRNLTSPTSMVAAHLSSGATQLIRAKVSSLPGDDLIVLDEAGQHLYIVSGDPETSDRGNASSISSSRYQVRASLVVDGEPLAVLPMRLNSDALSDLVVLSKGQNAPSVMMTTPASTFTVTNTNDTGSGSLRQAITDANNNLGADAITFNIPAGAPGCNSSTGVCTIRPVSPGLPAIVQALTIDGTTQPGYIASPVIEIFPSGTISNAALDGRANGFVARGLMIDRATGGHGIRLVGSSSIVEGNYIGTDGLARFGNGIDGIHIQGSSNNTIGGTTSAARNIISANSGAGVFLTATGLNNKIEGNLIGTDKNETGSLGNSDGILIENTTTTVIGVA